ncbi:flavin reductase family protein [Glutamicibacter sp. MNS18]|uniref:flavin reductase family protein n=1 Tax=Glutamicibacter sp. MNS18 TaxID=2989817 RepID=UPI002235BC5E|nr:flavin reductase family protein [Glutamicibacter sp. MNS18]MCW4465704.1 flavin reductase family protein [Glutamicibacter sp. MNS18]
MRIETEPDQLSSIDFYRLLTNLVIPRPIAWVSTVDEQGRTNLAPHSFFTVASANPPIVQFTSVGRKDTLRNIEQTGQFTVCLATRHHLEAVNATATEFEAGRSEFTEVGIQPEPSKLVAPPRVADSPAALECELERIIEVGDSFLVLGKVVQAAVSDNVYNDQRRPDAQLLNPLARLGGSQWSALGDIVTIRRIPLDAWDGVEGTERD